MNPLIAKLERRDRLTAEERGVLDAIPTSTRMVRAGQDLVREGDRPRESILMLKGFSGRYNTLRGGGRQISAVHIAGDFIDLHSFVLHEMDHGVVALSDCTVTAIPHDALQSISERFPHLTRMLWLSTLIDAAIQRRWLVAMGRQSSLAQLAHLLCELSVRLGVVDLVHNDTFELPLTQNELADVLGLSLVHVNRVVQELKRNRLLAWSGRRIRILDREGLWRVAEFDPLYLHLENEPR